MSKNLEIHLLQSFPTSNLNRDDVGSPKESVYGGSRRARISSQCLKKAIRREFAEGGLLAQEFLGIRSRQIIGMIKDKLTNDDRNPEDVLAVATLLVEKSAKAKPDAKKPEQTDTLLFLGRSEVDMLVDIGERYFDILVDGKKKDKIEKELEKEINQALHLSNTVDLALFGRMMASSPEHNVNAAAQVAHALGVSTLTTDFDFFTAVDELNSQNDTGSGHMGTLEFNSSTFYRYLNVNLDVLEENLGGDHELTLESVKALISATVRAVPTGKQTSTAAYTLPGFIMITVRDGGVPVSMAPAFEKPVRANHQHSITEAAIKKLDEYFGKVVKIYGENGLLTIGVCSTEDVILENLADVESPNLDVLIKRVMEVL